MTAGDDTFRRLQSAARSAAAKGLADRAPTQQYLMRHALESFLHRLSRTSHADAFVLTGGILMAAYGARRPTRDVDVNAVRADVTAPHLIDVVRAIAAVDADDGVAFDLSSIDIREIREHVDYPGFRVSVAVTIGPWAGAVAWDVSTGDPIVPAPQRVQLDRIDGEPFTLACYTPESIIAEKGVTILERGIASTRWRDYVDIVQLARQGIDADRLLSAAQAVARYRGISLEPISPKVAGYGQVAQPKWAAWRRKEALESVCEADLDQQMALVARYLDPVFGGASAPKRAPANPRTTKPPGWAASYWWS